jgi:hypothetical protein
MWFQDIWGKEKGGRRVILLMALLSDARLNRIMK